MKDAFIPLLRRIHGFLMAGPQGDSQAVEALTNENAQENTHDWVGPDTPVVGENVDDFGDDLGEDQFGNIGDMREQSDTDTFEINLEALREKIKLAFQTYFALNSGDVEWQNGSGCIYLYVKARRNCMVAKLTKWMNNQEDDEGEETGFGIDCFFEDAKYIRDLLDDTQTYSGLLHHYMFVNFSDRASVENWEGRCTFFDRSHRKRYDKDCSGFEAISDKICSWMCSNYVPETPGSVVSDDWEKEVLRSWSDQPVGSGASQQGERRFSM